MVQACNPTPLVMVMVPSPPVDMGGFSPLPPVGMGGSHACKYASMQVCMYVCMHVCIVLYYIVLYCNVM